MSPEIFHRARQLLRLRMSLAPHLPPQTRLANVRGKTAVFFAETGLSARKLRYQQSHLIGLLKSHFGLEVDEVLIKVSVPA